MSKKSLFHKILRIEPGIALGQWVYDRITANSTALFSLFIAGGGMTYLSFITAWAKQLGPAGIGMIALLSALISYYLLSLAQTNRATKRVQEATAQAISKWQSEVDQINPLDEEFNRKRIDILSFKHPISNRIEGKIFSNCQLIGPCNIIFSGSRASHVTFTNCDLITINTKTVLYNCVLFDNISIFGGEIVNCTIFIPPNMVESFKQTKDANFISGDIID